MNAPRHARLGLLMGFALLAIGIVAVCTSRAVAQTPPQVPRIIGEWSGKSKEDGVLSLVIKPAPGREVAYQFSGGTQEHASGTFTLRGANELDFTPSGESEAEKWTYSFDEQGQLHLEMEEDNPNDREVYTLARIR